MKTLTLSGRSQHEIFQPRLCAVTRHCHKGHSCDAVASVLLGSSEVLVATAFVSTPVLEYSVGGALVAVATALELNILQPSPFESIFKTRPNVPKYELVPATMYLPSVVISLE